MPYCCEGKEPCLEEKCLLYRTVKDDLTTPARGGFGTGYGWAGETPGHTPSHVEILAEVAKRKATPPAAEPAQL